MGEVFESLYKSLNQAIEIDRGERKTMIHPADDLPTVTLVGITEGSDTPSETKESKK